MQPVLTSARSRSVSEQDPLFPAAAHFTLGTAFDRVMVEPARPSLRRPFGMRHAVEPIPVEVDYTAARYDSVRQIAVIAVDGVAVPFARHTTGTTSTRTSDGHRGMDSDSDHRED
jgi:putative ATP-grasp target RiPP